jgi:hypothetical protein
MNLSKIGLKFNEHGLSFIHWPDATITLQVRYSGGGCRRCRDKRGLVDGSLGLQD